MKKIFSAGTALLIGLLTALLFISCDDKYEPTGVITPHSEPRDWTYDSNHSTVYIDGVEKTSVSEIRVTSELINLDEKRHSSTLKIKGLKKKNKVTDVVVEYVPDTFEGVFEMDGTTYDVSGEFIGSPFIPDEAKIVVNFTSRK